MRPLTPVLLFSLLISGCTLWKGPKNPSWKGATGAEQYERLMWKALQNKEWKDAEARLAPAFVGVIADGRKFDRAGWIEYWKSTPVTEFTVGEMTVQPNGADMVVTYELRLQVAGAATKGIRVVSVWQQLQRGWVLIAQSETPVP